MINVVTTPDLGKLLHRHQHLNNLPAESNYLPLQKWLKKKKATLNPTFPGTEAETLQTYFHLITPLKITQADLDMLLQLPGIEGAYEKPTDELPR